MDQSSLRKKFNKAVRLLWGGRCFFCGHHQDTTLMDVHHIVHRRNRILRWDINNGVLVCRLAHPDSPTGGKSSCHDYADSPSGIAQLGQEYPFEYLTKYKHIVFKEFLKENKMTEKEFDAETSAKLDRIIKAYKSEERPSPYLRRASCLPNNDGIKKLLGLED